MNDKTESVYDMVLKKGNIPWEELVLEQMEEVESDDRLFVDWDPKMINHNGYAVLTVQLKSTEGG